MIKMNCSIQIAPNTKASCYEKPPLLLQIVILMMNLNILYDFNIILSFILTLLIFQKRNNKNQNHILYFTRINFIWLIDLGSVQSWKISIEKTLIIKTKSYCFILPLLSTCQFLDIHSAKCKAEKKVHRFSQFSC